MGTLGGDTEGLSGSLRRSIDHRMAKECDSLPIWIPDEEFGKYYDEFCHQVLWPCLHYVIPDAPKTKYFYESSAWAQYKTVNQRFADAIVANYKYGDISASYFPGTIVDLSLKLLYSLGERLPSHAPPRNDP